MRSGWHVQRSASHRLACVSLYRTLLRQCNGFSDTITDSTLRELVRHRFLKDRKLQSIPQIQNALNLGYKAQALLDKAASGSEDALQTLMQTVSAADRRMQEISLLRSHQASLRSPTSPRKIAKFEHIQRVRAKENHLPRPGAIPVLERPVPKPELPGPRRIVPRFRVAQGVPFLQYGARQPVRLSRVLRQLMTADTKRWEVHYRLEREMAMAQLEDEWEDLLAANTGYRDLLEPSLSPTAAGPKWTETIKEVDQDLMQKIHDKSRERTEMAKKMWHVVVEERDLAEKEKKERKMEKRKQRHETEAENEENNGISV